MIEEDDLANKAFNLEKALMDQGLFVEGGWQSFVLMAVLPTASPFQLETMRNAFFAGAVHTFSAILEVEGGLFTLGQIQTELENFLTEFKAKRGLN